MIVSDSGPLIALARIGRLDLLRDLFGAVVIPQAVADECLPRENRPGSKAIAQALKQGWLRKQKLPAQTSLLGRPTMGDGENSAITLAHHRRCPLLVDDRAARKVAALHGLTVVGTAGALIEAKRRRLIPKVKPLVEDLRQCGYRLSDELVSRVLARCREDR